MSHNWKGELARLHTKALAAARETDPGPPLTNRERRTLRKLTARAKGGGRWQIRGRQRRKDYRPPTEEEIDASIAAALDAVNGGIHGKERAEAPTPREGA